MTDYSPLYRVSMRFNDEIRHALGFIWDLTEAFKAKEYYESVGVYDAVWLEKAVWQPIEGSPEAVQG